MMVSADTLKRLSALKLPTEAFQEVLLILAEMQGADDARRERQRHRKAKSRDKSVTVTGQERDESVTASPSDSLKKERKIPEPSGSGPTQAELERELFSRGRQVCGKSSGGLVNSLLKAKQFDVALARSVIELAATKNDPREFVAAASRSNPRNGHDESKSLLAAADRQIEHFGGMEAARNYVPGSSGPRPLSLDLGPSPPSVRLLPKG